MENKTIDQTVSYTIKSDNEMLGYVILEGITTDTEALTEFNRLTNNRLVKSKDWPYKLHKLTVTYCDEIIAE